MGALKNTFWDRGMFFMVPQWQFSLSNRCFIYLTHPPRIPRGTNSQINFALFFINKDFFFFSLNCRKQEQLDGKRGAGRATWATARLPNPAVWVMQSSSRQLLAVVTHLGQLRRIHDHTKELLYPKGSGTWAVHWL